MLRCRVFHCRQHVQAGAVIIEYLLATGIVVSVLFLPVPGQDDSVVRLVLDVFREIFNETSYWLSLP